MSGALTQSMARGWAGGGRARRRYADGGAAGGDPQMDDDAYSGLPPPAMPPTAPARQGALALANPDSLPPQPPGALGQMAPQNGGPPDQQDPDAQRKMFDLNRAMMVLRASSGTNPLLAAAGAMLAPTRTGGFSESLGNAFTAYGKAGEQERATDEQMAERMLQAQWQNDYRQQMAAAATSRASSYGTSVDNRGQLQDAQTQVALAKVPLEQAQAAKVSSQAAVSAAENGRFVYQGNNPDGLPVFYDSRNPSRMVVGDVPLAPKTTDALKIGVQQQNADTSAAKVDQNAPLVAAKIAAIQATQEYHDAIVQMRKDGIAFTQASAAANLAAKIQAASPGTPWPKALAQAKAGLPGQSSMPPASSGAPAAATQPAPAATTPAPAATAPQTPPAGYPNARWSGKHGAFLVPGSAPGKWKVVGGAGGDVSP